LGVALLAAWVTACAPDATRGARRHYHAEAGIGFDHPAEWSVHDASTAFSGGSVIAILGTLPVAPRCGAVHVDINCYYERRLDPGTISIVLGTGSFGGGTIFDERPPGQLEVGERERTDVDGLPAFVHRYGPGGYYEQDEAVGWEVAFPTSVLNAFGIEARMRGPGVETMRAELDRLVASIRLDAPGPAVSGDPAGADPTVAAALAELDRSMRRSWVARPEHVSWYACFPATGGLAQRRVITLGPNGPLAAPRSVECRYAVAAESRRLWRVALDVDGGQYVETLWLTGDGKVAGSRRQGAPPS
jgi:hypothetical protein